MLDLNVVANAFKASKKPLYGDRIEFFSSFIALAINQSY